MALFGGAIALSAFLLFWIQPLIGQVILPVFGGTPAVWATVLVFFQGVVLFGYGYSHLSVTRLGPRRGAILHVVLAVFALVWLTVMPIRVGGHASSGLPEALEVLRILVLGIGPPVAVLTATTPLLSAWFVTTRRRDAGDGRRPAAGAREAGDPYWLYALSNAASLGALLAYPLVLGPIFGVSRQGTLWTAAFLVLVGLLTAAAFVVVRRVPTTTPVEPTPVEPTPVAGRPLTAHPTRLAIGWRRRATWILLAAVPSGLLAAVTNFIAADLIAAPLLWIGPLALYLCSFIVAFSARGRRIVPLAVAMAPVAVTVLWTPIGSAGGWPILPLIVLEWAGLAIVATALHGRLAADRPPASGLTGFYLVQSIGGVLGGALVALVAPVAFEGIWEFPILLIAALVALALTAPDSVPDDGAAVEGAGQSRRRLNLRPFIAGARWRLLPYAIVAGGLALTMSVDGSIALPVAIRWFSVGALLLLVGGPPRFLALATALVLALATFVLPKAALIRDRSFFGVTEVVASADGRWIELFNGTTVHGTQSTDPLLRRTPTFYYAPSGPLGDIFDRLDAVQPNAAIGVLGLGAGAIAAYSQPGQSMTFFEIDPVVVEVASNPRYFTYLSDARVPPRIVLGDGRLSLREEAAASLDLLILDAFSSDAIPAHLITAEALAEDTRVIRPGGVLAFHVSNRYYDIGPAIGAAGAELGLTVLERRYSPTPADAAAGAAPSIWLVASAAPAAVEWFEALAWQPVAAEDLEPLTDDHPDVLRFLDLGS